MTDHLKVDRRITPERLAGVLQFGGFEIVDADGKVIGTDPREFPELMKRCAEVVATIQTGNLHRIKEEGK